jgi:hypothetical protein
MKRDRTLAQTFRFARAGRPEGLRYMRLEKKGYDPFSVGLRNEVSGGIGHRLHGSG